MIDFIIRVLLFVFVFVLGYGFGSTNTAKLSNKSKGIIGTLSLADGDPGEPPYMFLTIHEEYKSTVLKAKSGDQIILLVENHTEEGK